MRFPVTSVTADVATIGMLIHTSGTMACRDQPRADRQCRMIKTWTTPRSTSETGMSIALTASQMDREP